MIRLLRNRTAQLSLLFTTAVVCAGAGDTSAQFSSIGHKLVCMCGCTQILLECNHVNCPVSGPMIGELKQQLASGNSETSIFNWFAAKYGPTALGSPMRGGFDNAAWIVPVTLFLLATMLTIFVVYRWKNRTQLAAPAGSVPFAGPSDDLRERIRKETEY